MTTPIWPIAVGSVPSVIDLSHNNAKINTPTEFQALKAAGIGLILHKCTQGVGFTDPMYAPRKALALAAGIKFDAYHFCTNDPIDRQLDHFLQAVGPIVGMRLGLDAEPNRGSTIDPANAAAMSMMLDAKTGVKCLRYGNASVLEYKQPGWHDGPLWWAKYGSEPTVELMRQLGLDPSSVVLWQESATGRVAGESPVDLSYARFDVSSWPELPIAASAPFNPLLQAPVGHPDPWRGYSLRGLLIAVLNRQDNLMIDDTKILASVAAAKTQVDSLIALATQQNATMKDLSAQLAAAIAANDPAAIAQVQADLDTAAAALDTETQAVKDAIAANTAPAAG